MGQSELAHRDSELLTQAIEASGLSLRRFAEYVLLRDERVVRRWKNAEREMPRYIRALVSYWAKLSPSDILIARRFIDHRIKHDVRVLHRANEKDLANAK